MRKLFLAATVAMFGGLVTGAPASAAPTFVATPSAETIIAQIKHYGPPHGKKCLKWTRRYHSSLGMGHKRCVHWQ